MRNVFFFNTEKKTSSHLRSKKINCLVVGFSPSEKYESIFGVKVTNIWNQHLDPPVKSPISGHLRREKQILRKTNKVDGDPLTKAGTLDFLNFELLLVCHGFKPLDFFIWYVVDLKRFKSFHHIIDVLSSSGGCFGSFFFVKDQKLRESMGLVYLLAISLSHAGKKRPYFPLNPGCSIGMILISWFLA